MTNLPDFTVSFLKSYLKKNTIEKIHLLLGRIWIQSTNYVLPSAKRAGSDRIRSQGLGSLFSLYLSLVASLPVFLPTVLQISVIMRCACYK